MAEAIDETTILAWLDGELSDAETAWMTGAIAADPALAALAERHRRMKARFVAAFDPIARPSLRIVEPPPAPVISLAAVRAERAAAGMPPRRWAVPIALAAGLLAGLLCGRFLPRPVGISDRAGASALAPPLARALDTQLSSDAGPLRVAFSFRNRAGDYCRSFEAVHLAGIACRTAGHWQMRAAGATDAAGSEGGTAQMAAAMISGEPLDRATEAAARARGWR